MSSSTHEPRSTERDERRVTDRDLDRDGVADRDVDRDLDRARVADRDVDVDRDRDRVADGERLAAVQADRFGGV
jgi:hypothetical protein